MIVSRAIAFLRVLVVAKLLGDAGQREFGLYQPALEFINWLVPLVMFGMGDVAERYAAGFQRDAALASFLKRQVLRLLAVGVIVVAILLVLSPFLANAVFKISAVHDRAHGILLVAACAATILLLALYQYLAAVLRGITAYAPAAAMEAIAAVLFFALSALAAWKGGALDLILMYGLSLLLPIIFFGSMLITHLRQQPQPATASPPQPPPPPRFAAFSLLRLLLVMTFGFLSVWSVSHLAHDDPQKQTAAYTMPYRIAQLLAYVAVTLWASTYGLAAKAWSHRQTRRAKVQLFRIGKFGAVALTLLALVLLPGRYLFAAILPGAYAAPIINLLPPMLALFTWYGLLAFASTYADLQEKPHKGAILWAAAVITQLALVLVPAPGVDPQQQVLYASSLALAGALLILAPILLWRPFKATATAIPLALLALAPISLFAPYWVVDYIAPPVLLAALLFLVISGLLVRPLDKRAWRSLRQRRRPTAR